MFRLLVLAIGVGFSVTHGLWWLAGAFGAFFLLALLIANQKHLQLVFGYATAALIILLITAIYCLGRGMLELLGRAR